MKRKPVRTKRAPPLPEAQEDLNAVSAALYDDAPAGDVEASARAGESVEDPLQDWPESDGEADGWLKERRCRGDGQFRDAIGMCVCVPA